MERTCRNRDTARSRNKVLQIDVAGAGMVHETLSLSKIRKILDLGELWFGNNQEEGGKREKKLGQCFAPFALVPASIASHLPVLDIRRW